MSLCRFVYHERRLPGIRVKIRSDVRLFNIEDGLAAAWGAFESDHPLEAAGELILTTPGSAVDDGEACWGFGDLPARLLGGGEQRRAVLSSFLILSVHWG